jgi:hypothetical protein
LFISVTIWFSIMRRSLDVRGNVLNCAAIKPGRPRASGSKATAEAAARSRAEAAVQAEGEAQQPLN